MVFKYLEEFILQITAGHLIHILFLKQKPIYAVYHKYHGRFSFASFFGNG